MWPHQFISWWVRCAASKWCCSEVFVWGSCEYVMISPWHLCEIKFFTGMSVISFQTHFYLHYANDLFLKKEMVIRHHPTQCHAELPTPRPQFISVNPEQCTWIPWNLSFHYILFHEKRLQAMLWRQSQFTPKMKANAVPRLLSSLVWIDQYNECDGMTTFMEFMLPVIIDMPSRVSFHIL